MNVVINHVAQSDVVRNHTCTLDSSGFHRFRRTTRRLRVVAGGLRIGFEGMFSLFCSQGCLLVVVIWLKPDDVVEEVTSSTFLAVLLVRDRHRTGGLGSRSRCCCRIVAIFGMAWRYLFKVHMSDDD